MKFLKVDMSSQAVSTSDVPDAYAGLGGRGLTSIMINNEVPADCDPLGPDNKLIFAPGYLSGTVLVNSSRLSIGAKSPLTGGIKESNVGGTVAADMGHLGITAVIVDGKPADADALYLLKIDAEGNAALLDGSAYKGLRTYELVRQLKEAHGEKNSITCIGPAGEFLLSSSSIQTTDADGRPCRAAGRGGLGAVMASKGLKAVIVDRGGKATDPVFKHMPESCSRGQEEKCGAGRRRKRHRDTGHKPAKQEAAENGQNRCGRKRKGDGQHIDGKEGR